MLQAHCLGSQPRFQGVGWCSKPQFPHCGGDAAGGMRIIEHSLAASVPAVPADLGCGTGGLPHQGRACQGHSTLTCPHWGLHGSGSVVLPAPLRAGSCLSRQPLLSISVIPALEHRPPTEGASPQRARGQTAAALRAPGEADVDSCCDATKDCSGRGCPLGTRCLHPERSDVGEFQSHSPTLDGPLQPQCYSDSSQTWSMCRPQELPAGTGLPCHTVSLQPVRGCPGRVLWSHQ
ncbi:uncharacterized protein [Macaca nemestrina]|uniref:uncharacterized protein isoform X2 n=1 Tax=Macaca nemestrina TaxID=9545 RepID=UPI0005F50DC9|nr:uncharacterized protein LOC105489905 isoform X1 [Macaca nemestrina]